MSGAWACRMGPHAPSRRRSPVKIESGGYTVSFCPFRHNVSIRAAPFPVCGNFPLLCTLLTNAFFANQICGPFEITTTNLRHARTHTPARPGTCDMSAPHSARDEAQASARSAGEGTSPPEVAPVTAPLSVGGFGEAATGFGAPPSGFGTTATAGFGASAAGGFGAPAPSFGGAFTGGDPLSAFTSANRPRISFASFASGAPPVAPSLAPSPAPAAPPASSDASPPSAPAATASPSASQPPLVDVPAGVSVSGVTLGPPSASATGSKRRRDAVFRNFGIAAPPPTGGESPEHVPSPDAPRPPTHRFKSTEGEGGAGSGGAGGSSSSSSFSPAASEGEGRGSPRGGGALGTLGTDAAWQGAEGVEYAVPEAVALLSSVGTVPANSEGSEVTVLQPRARLFVLDKKGEEEGGPPRWREVGVGPLRVNVDRAAHSSRAGGGGGDAPPAHARLVMRQESHPGGSGTRLLLNAALYDGIPASRHPVEDRCLQLSCVTEPPRVFAGAAAPAVEGDGDAGDAPPPPPSGEVFTFLIKLPKVEGVTELLAAIRKWEAL